jgi:hypothetical protein
LPLLACVPSIYPIDDRHGSQQRNDREKVKARWFSTEISTAKYPRIVFAVTIKLLRVLRLDDLGSSASGDDVRKACLEENDLAASVDVATHLGKDGIQGLILPSVVKGGDDNLIVYVANCDPGALQIQNGDEFVQEAKKMVTKSR